MNRKIKIIALSVALLLSSLLSYSYAQKCKYEYQKTDGLTGNTLKAIQYEASGTLTLRCKKVNDGYEIDILIYFQWADGGEAYSRGQTMRMEVGDSLTFKLSTGEIVSLYATKQLIPVQKANGWGSFLTYDALSTDKNNMEKLANTTVSYIRVNFGKDVYDAFLKEKSAKQLQSSLNCLLQ
ncbi:MAG: hypothetical protein LBI60_00550 [Bacteroidales bacterium]|jgi:hypothetical protein|nr:hypothetical protein [Bacteroidales bacterium]